MRSGTCWAVGLAADDGAGMVRVGDRTMVSAAVLPASSKTLAFILSGGRRVDAPTEEGPDGRRDSVCMDPVVG